MNHIIYLPGGVLAWRFPGYGPPGFDGEESHPPGWFMLASSPGVAWNFLDPWDYWNRMKNTHVACTSDIFGDLTVWGESLDIFGRPRVDMVCP
jgi:hypothetical protein